MEHDQRIKEIFGQVLHKDSAAERERYLEGLAGPAASGLSAACA
jgi:hypothetical protein